MHSAASSHPLAVVTLPFVAEDQDLPIRLTVRDPKGSSTSVTLSLHVTARPVPEGTLGYYMQLLGEAKELQSTDLVLNEALAVLSLLPVLANLSSAEPSELDAEARQVLMTVYGTVSDSGPLMPLSQQVLPGPTCGQCSLSQCPAVVQGPGKRAGTGGIRVCVSWTRPCLHVTRRAR